MLIILLFFALLLTALAVIAFSVQKRLARAEDEARHQQQNLRYELYAKLHPLEEALYRQQPGVETVLYDGREKVLPDDFTGGGTRAWDYVGHEFEKGTGEGSFNVAGNTISVHRTNTAGRFELHLQRYSVNGKETGELPADAAKTNRLLRLHCEVKRDAASHGLRFVFKSEESKEVLDEKDAIAFNPGWQAVELYFNVSAAEPTHLRIDDLHVMRAPGSVQIRRIVLFEKR